MLYAQADVANMSADTSSVAADTVRVARFIVISTPQNGCGTDVERRFHRNLDMADVFRVLATRELRLQARQGFEQREPGFLVRGSMEPRRSRRPFVDHESGFR